MQININSVIDSSLEATDGEIGKITSFYFDDDTWTIRYMVVKTGSWLSGRKVLISTDAILKDSWEGRRVRVDLTKEKIGSSPDIDTEKPVSQQQDIQLYGHYAWQNYGGSGFYAGGLGEAMDNVPIIDEKIITKADPNDKRSDDDLHLRSTKTIIEYHVHTSDGDFGHVSDFVFDDANWQIIYVVVDSNNWFGGKKFLIKTGTIKEIQWENSKVILNISKEAIKDCPVFDESVFKHSQSASAPLENS